jgi:DNA-binding CsgD family transcriptional regulator
MSMGPNSSFGRMNRRLNEIPDDIDESLIGSKVTIAKQLTFSEKRTLELASRGLHTKMIADEMFIGDETVKTHLAHARFKMRAKNTTHAVAEAIRKGIID